METLGTEGVPQQALLLSGAIYKLRHAVGGEFSALITVKECQALLYELECLWEAVRDK